MEMIREIGSFIVDLDDNLVREIWNGAWFLLGLSMVISFFMIAIQRYSAKQRVRPLYNDVVFQVCLSLCVFSIASTTRAGYIWLLLHCQNVYGTEQCDWIEGNAWIVAAAGLCAITAGVCIIRVLSPRAWQPWIWITAGVFSLGLPFLFYGVAHWFSFGHPTPPLLEGHYDPFLVGASIVEAMLASYVALELMAHSQITRGVVSWMWTATAAIIMGGGIWTMHFIAMLSFSLEGTHVSYDWKLTALSFVTPIFVTLCGFLAIKVTSRSLMPVVVCGTAIGIGIASMHYIGMLAMNVQQGAITYDVVLFAASVVIAILASISAVWISTQDIGTSIIERKILASIIGGFAVSGMHYTGMAGTTFCKAENAVEVTSLDQYRIGVLATIVSISVILCALAVSTIYRRVKGG